MCNFCFSIKSTPTTNLQLLNKCNVAFKNLILLFYCIRNCIRLKCFIKLKWTIRISYLIFISLITFLSSGSGSTGSQSQFLTGELPLSLWFSAHIWFTFCHSSASQDGWVNTRADINPLYWSSLYRLCKQFVICPQPAGTQLHHVYVCYNRQAYVTDKYAGLFLFLSQCALCWHKQFTELNNNFISKLWPCSERNCSGTPTFQSCW